MRYSQTFRFILEKTVNLCNGSIEGTDYEFVIGNVHNQVLTHDGQADEAEVSTGMFPRWSADVDAGKTGATVSPWCSSTFAQSRRQPEIAALLGDVQECRPAIDDVCLHDVGRTDEEGNKK